MKYLYLFCCVVSLLLAACQPATLQLNIKAPPGTNQGRPFYMLVRKVAPAQYAAESYSDISAYVVQPNANVIHSEIIYPGTLRHILVKVPPDSSLAVSFLFTAPDGTWQSFLSPPLPPSLDVDLQESRIRTELAPTNPSTEAVNTQPATGLPAALTSPKS
jgi:hypothetical protein